MHHTSAYGATIANTGNVDTAAVPDGILTIQNNHFILNEQMSIVYAAAMGITLQRARLNSPTNRQITLPFLRPITVGTAIPGAEPRVADYRDQPFVITPGEEQAMEISQGAAGAEEEFVIVGWMKQFMRAPAGQILEMRLTSVTAAVADLWTQVVVVPADNLPSGTYLVLGLEHQSANARAARMIIENQFYRPGCVSVPTLGARQHEMFRRGGLGTWGQFHSYRLPNFEVLCNAADAAHEFYMDVMRISAVATQG